MTKTNNIIYLSDNYIYLKNYKHKNIIKYNVAKGIIINNKIANIKLFNNTLNNLIKKYKLNNSLFKESITIIINDTYTDVDKFILNNLFESFNYKNIIFINENKTYNLNNNIAYINIKEDNILLTYIDSYKNINTIYIPSNYYDSIKDLCRYINNKIGNKEITLLGYGNLLNDFFNYYEKNYNIAVYLYTNSEFYIIDKYSKKICI